MSTQRCSGGHALTSRALSRLLRFDDKHQARQSRPGAAVKGDDHDVVLADTIEAARWHLANHEAVADVVRSSVT